MEFYRMITTTKHQGYAVGCSCIKVLSENKPDDYVDELTWENLNEMYQKHGLTAKFNVWNLKKGRLVSFFIDGFFPRKWERDVKEWKTKELDMTIETSFIPINNVSIDDVLKWHEPKKAMQYLKEKGLLDECQEMVG